MTPVSRLRLIVLCISLVVVSLACQLFNQAVESVSPAAAQPTTSAPVEQLPMPTAVPEGAQTSGSQLTLTLPDGQTVPLVVSNCTGKQAGQYLDVRAANSSNPADPNRLQVQIGGTHSGSGSAGNMFITITIGAADAWSFMGNTPSASVTLENNGSGHFDGVGIINAAESTTYKNNQEYKFSALWTCSQ